jgi:hypothetical protein
LFFILSFFFVSIAHSQDSTSLAAWRTLGSVQAKFSAQRNLIIVKGLGKYHTIKLRSDVGIQIPGIRIVYADDSTDDIAISQALKAGEETGAIIVPQPDKDIRDVEFQYASPSKKKKGRANVTLLGLK